MEQNQNEIAFFCELRGLLDRYDVEISATDDGKPYGQHSPLVEFQFRHPYGCYEFHEVTVADEPESDHQNKVG